jgi:hypothetical protein
LIAGVRAMTAGDTLTADIGSSRRAWVAVTVTSWIWIGRRLRLSPCWCRVSAWASKDDGPASKASTSKRRNMNDLHG